MVWIWGHRHSCCFAVVVPVFVPQVKHSLEVMRADILIDWACRAKCTIMNEQREKSKKSSHCASGEQGGMEAQQDPPVANGEYSENTQVYPLACPKHNHRPAEAHVNTWEQHSKHNLCKSVDPYEDNYRFSCCLGLWRRKCFLGQTMILPFWSDFAECKIMNRGNN